MNVIRLYKEFSKLYSKKINNPIKKMAKDFKRHFMKEDIQMIIKQMKIC